MTLLKDSSRNSLLHCEYKKHILQLDTNCLWLVIFLYSHYVKKLDLTYSKLIDMHIYSTKVFSFSSPYRYVLIWNKFKNLGPSTIWSYIDVFFFFSQIIIRTITFELERNFNFDSYLKMSLNMQFFSFPRFPRVKQERNNHLLHLSYFLLLAFCAWSYESTYIIMFLRTFLC